MERVVHISGRHDQPDVQEMDTSPREVTICCIKCKKSFKLTYTEVGDPNSVAFRNMGFACGRCKRKKFIREITEGVLLRNVTMWNAVYI